MYPYIEDWAEAQSIKVEGWLGSGDFGEAFSTECGKVIKVTGDIKEFMAAFTLQGVKSDYIVDIYKAELTDDDYLFILMEALDTEGVEDLFYQAQNLVDEYAFGEWEYFDADELPEDMPVDEDALSMINDICASMMDLRQKGIDLPDVHDGNIGKKNGRYALFDFQMTESRSLESFKAYIREEQAKKLVAKPAAKPPETSLSMG